MKISLRFVGGCGGSVTGSCSLLEVGESKLLVDCGLFQGEDAGRNHRPFSFDPPEINWVVLTHAHIDHCGLVPRLYREQYRRSVVATEATVELAQVILEDSVHLQAGRKKPLYRLPDVKKALEQFEGFPYEEPIHLNRSLQIRLRDAGHILGSAILEVGIEMGKHREMKIVFSGDVGNQGTSLLPDPSEVEGADLLVIESTYGDRCHPEKEERLEELAQIVNRSLKDGGKILIPAFAIGRAQELLYDFNFLVEGRKIPRVPIILDSPMAVAATRLFQQYPHLFDREARALLARGDDPLEFAGLYTAESLRESEAIWQIEGSAILICPSGMCEGGRIVNHLKHYLEDARTEILFVGYQARGTLGRILQGGAEEVWIDGKPYPNRAKAYTLPGYSAHADQEGLLDWVGRMRNLPRQVFVVHGEESASRALAEAIRERFGIEVMVPGMDQEVALD
ncbi:MAG: MBL fold metallo-hydrolase [Candidatus Tectomicrobia bacterium]|uniref:MBL fold metallo-hydrolase n=1 Tax=Tectimicrobiota bacterium TaxID=2528274 RepID=A0A932CR62_UNCTE|nr:MBL fold metallo-hydrolase [Candidatus Tectomicrobia bacterium]